MNRVPHKLIRDTYFMVKTASEIAGHSGLPNVSSGLAGLVKRWELELIKLPQRGRPPKNNKIHPARVGRKHRKEFGYEQPDDHDGKSSGDSEA